MNVKYANTEYNIIIKYFKIVYYMKSMRNHIERFCDDCIVL